jgi:hypothetical protein
LQAATPVDVSAIIIITTSERLLIPEELLARICDCRLLEMSQRPPGPAQSLGHRAPARGR